MKHIEKACGDLIEFVNPEHRDVVFVLAVQGCKVACADLTQFKGIPIRIITCVEDAERLVNEIIENNFLYEKGVRSQNSESRS
ncbi:MAG: hypothetical protein J7L53_04070 [Deltaproteobacteria bacterium]|nr:hypothetical protein [Deltaproteobacteria bacterium]